jgi:transcription elongation factor GreA
MDKKRISPNGIKLINEKINQLNEERLTVVERLDEARKLGDLRENAQYAEARDRLVQIDKELESLNSTILESIVISEVEKKDYVDFGATIEIESLSDNRVNKYKIVGDFESDIEKGLISEESPLVQAMLNKKVNDVFQLTTEISDKSFKILSIEY